MIVGLYIHVSTVQVYKYEVREGKGSGQKGTNMDQGGLRASLSTDPFKKVLVTVVKEGQRRLVFPLPPTQNLVGVGHMTIANLLGDVSGLYGVFFM